MLVLVDAGVVVVVEEKGNVTRCNVYILLILTHKITCRFVVSCLAMF